MNISVATIRKIRAKLVRDSGRWTEIPQQSGVAQTLVGLKD